MKTTHYNGHMIQIDAEGRVIYDGQLVATRPNPMASGSYLFAIDEDGETAEYEVTIGITGLSKNWVVIRRNEKHVFVGY